jgi:hypothetical protein
MRITNTGGTPLDTNQMAASITFNGHAFATPAACGIIAPGGQCQVAFHIYTLTSYVIMVTDPRNGDQLQVITP